MKHFDWIRVLLFLPTLAVILQFQNCGQSMQPSSDSSPQETKIAFSLQYPDGTPINESQAVDLGTYFQIRIPNPSRIQLSNFRWILSSSPEKSCTQSPTSTAQDELSIICTVQGEVWIEGIGTSIQDGSEQRFYSQRRIRSPRVTPPVVSDLVIFRIAAGTGTGPWNRPENEVELFVGQTLRFINEDQMLHQLKTPSIPCEAATIPMENEDFFDCKIQTAYSPANQGTTYDAIYGPSAPFFMSSRDGKAIYDRNCLGCHGGIASTSKRGRTADAIKFAIGQVSEMQGLAQTLSDTDLRAVAFSLK